jgi:hypothetical protein
VTIAALVGFLLLALLRREVLLRARHLAWIREARAGHYATCDRIALRP